MHLYKTIFFLQELHMSVQNWPDSEWNVNSVEPAEKQLCTFSFGTTFYTFGAKPLMNKSCRSRCMIIEPTLFCDRDHC